MAVTIIENGKAYRIAGLACTVRTSDAFVTIYEGAEDGCPVATMQRRRMYDVDAVPVWTVWGLDGRKLAQTSGKLWTVVRLLKDTAKALAEREAAVAQAKAERDAKEAAEFERLAKADAAIAAHDAECLRLSKMGLRVTASTMRRRAMAAALAAVLGMGAAQSA